MKVSGVTKWKNFKKTKTEQNSDGRYENDG